MSAENYSHLACPNPDCAAYGQRGAGNLRLHGWSGKGHRIRCLHCATCGTDFSERANTPLFGLTSSDDTLAAIAEHLADGCGVRATAPGCARSAATLSCVSPNAQANTPSCSTTAPSEASIPNRSSLTRPGPSWGKKDKNRAPLDPDDAQQGSYWDHVIIDPETKLVVSLVVGRRDADTVVEVFTDFYERTDGYLPELICTDEYAVYRTVILDTYGVLRCELELTPEEDAEFSPGEFFFPEEITYATVHKEKEGGRVVEVSERLVLGSEEQLERTLEESGQSESVNTSFVERYHGTHRHFNARKKRKAYTFSKELCFHAAATWLVVLWYNFGWCVRTLREKVQEDPPRYHYRTPAMAAGLADHVWAMRELLGYPVYPPKEAPPQSKPRTYADVLERLKGVFVAETTDGS